MRAHEGTTGWRPTVLILGGTAEASRLASLVSGRFGERLRVVTSLAGRTREPAPIAGEVRHGGFGGAAGLAAYLRDEAVDLLVDATHPFAAIMSRHARLAAETAAVPRLTLSRSGWQRRSEDRWIEVDSAAAAAAVLPTLGRRVWLTFGDGLEVFQGLSEHWFLVRRVERPREPLPLPDHELILARGPFEEEAELALIRRHAIEVVVSKASGGTATAAKLAAARRAGVPVVMIRRPAPEPGPRVESPDEAVAWIANMLGEEEVRDGGSSEA